MAFPSACPQPKREGTTKIPKRFGRYLNKGWLGGLLTEKKQ